MKTRPSFTYPHVVPNLYGFLFSVEHKVRYFISMTTVDCLVTNIRQNIFFVCVQQKKETHAGLEQLEGE